MKTYIKAELISISIVLFLALHGCSHSQSKISFEELTMFGHTDTSIDLGKTRIVKARFYIIEGFRDTKEVEKKIDSFVNKNKDPNLSHYTQFTMVFYKKSSITNIEHLAAHKRDLDRYSQNNDLVYSYYWTDGGKFRERYKYKNGEMVEPKSNIKVEDIPDSTQKKD